MEPKHLFKTGLFNESQRVRRMDEKKRVD